MYVCMIFMHDTFTWCRITRQVFMNDKLISLSREVFFLTMWIADVFVFSNFFKKEYIFKIAKKHGTYK